MRLAKPELDCAQLGECTKTMSNEMHISQFNNAIESNESELTNRFIVYLAIVLSFN